MDMEGNIDDGAGKNWLLQMPTLVSDNILKYLTGKELLTLRRVCKSTKGWVSSSSRTSWNGYRLEIRSDWTGFDGTRTFEAAVHSGLNVTEIYINNPGDDCMDIYNSPALVSFIRTFGSYIRKLKVQNFGTCFSDNEFSFFESLTNLRELKLHLIDARKRGENDKDIPARFPSCFRNLKVLKFGNIMSPTDAPFNTSYHWDLVRSCPQLEYLRFPVASHEYEKLPSNEDIDTYYQPIMNYIRDQQASPQGLTLRTLDLKYVFGEDDMVMTIGYPILLLYLRNELKDSIRVRNTHADMMFPGYAQYAGVPVYSDACNGLIESMINLQGPVAFLDLPRLTKLVINSTDYSCINDINDFNPAKWNNLKTISILLDYATQKLRAFNVTGYLFKHKRPSVEKVIIVFDEDRIPEAEENPMGFISCRTLARNFVNLKILELVRFNTKNISFLKLWEGLSLLEELTIEDCSTFGNVALIGEDTRNPTFLKLKYLWKLRLKLDEMPLVTDRAFRDVFSKMKLREFYLQAIDPLEKVTESGILSLLEGQFGRSIEKFPFKSWSLASLNFIQFKELGKKFRSVL